MSKSPYFKLYFSDLAGDTLHLSDAEIGSYVLLLGAMWNAGGYLSSDPSKLARIARVTPAKWAGRWASLSPFFEVDENGVSHKRLSSERKKAFGISADRSEIGKQGAEAKRLKTLELAQANACESDEQTPQQTPSIPDTIAKEREDKLPSLSAGKPSKASGGGKPIKGAIPDSFPDEPAILEAAAWIAARGLVVDPAVHARRFRNHALSEGRTSADWGAAWRNWIDIEMDKASPVSAASATPLDTIPEPWTGPADVWDFAIARKGLAWANRYLRSCEFKDGALVTTSITLAKGIRQDLAEVLAEQNIRVFHASLEQAA